MKSEEKRGAGENELKKIRAQLVQIKLLLVAILLLLLAPLIGPGPIVELVLVGLLGLGAIYAGLRTFEGLVKRKVGQDWSEAQLASYLDDSETSSESENSGGPR